jgi:RNA polymerase sigma-70 factor (ECF subfamily)
MDEPDHVAAFTRCVAEHGPAVRAYAWALLRDDHHADDVTQEVFSRLWQHWTQYREQGRMRAYLLRIADRLIMDGYRSLHRRDSAVRELSQLASSADVGTPEQDLALQEARRALQRALDQLTPIQQRVLLLRYYGQMTFAEISATLKLPINTVLSHCHRGLKSLRKLLAEYAE